MSAFLLQLFDEQHFRNKQRKTEQRQKEATEKAQEIERSLVKRNEALQENNKRLFSLQAKDSQRAQELEEQIQKFNNR